MVTKQLEVYGNYTNKSVLEFHKSVATMWGIEESLLSMLGERLNF
jgi:hypothetical protein